METNGTTNYASTVTSTDGTLTWIHPYEIESQKDVSERLLNIAEALKVAVDMHFMRPEHGANIWKQYLKKSGVDTTERKE